MPDRLSGSHHWHTARALRAPPAPIAPWPVPAQWWRRRGPVAPATARRSEEHTSELQSLMRISYAVFCLKKKNKHTKYTHSNTYDTEHNTNTTSQNTCCYISN